MRTSGRGAVPLLAAMLLVVTAAPAVAAGPSHASPSARPESAAVSVTEAPGARSASTAPSASTPPNAPDPSAPQWILHGCGRVDADASRGVNDRIRGFASFTGEGCTTSSIWYFRSTVNGWLSALSPYAGTVVAAAQDGTGTFVLYRAADGLRLGKRSLAGSWSPSVRLSSSAVDGVTGDLVADRGTWWAVWSEPIGSHGTGELFQAKTFGTDLGRTRITTDGVPDGEPTLALHPDRGAVLAWTRSEFVQATVEPDGSDIWLGRSEDGTWLTRPFAIRGQHNSSPDLFASGGLTFLAWARDRGIRYADDTTGRFRVTRFPAPEGAALAVRPRVSELPATATSYLGWLELGEEFEPIRLAQRRAGVWAVTVVTGVGPGGAGMLRLHAVVARRADTTVVYSAGSTLFAAR